MRKATQHTPGPWTVTATVTPDMARAHVVATIRDADGWEIVHQTGVGPRAEANARLITEAPAMLEALKTLVAEWEAVADDSIPVTGGILQARAILARIEGTE